MQELTEARSYPVATFSKQDLAEQAINVLKSKFSGDRLTLSSQALEPAINQTQAAGSAKGGAIAGALMGAIVGIWLGYMSLYGDLLGNIDPVRHLVGLGLAGSGIGAAGGSLLAAITGSNVIKVGIDINYSDQVQGYAIFLQGTPDEVAQARKTLQAQGVDIQSGVALE
ncbi:MAG: hypothetical protein HC772_01610 [Leptolyngbyaceae cyanobacterium CRU_2_3]|nr:hypothetical protein [Leptolyngbyaceae cyanobacterium CRU_2_3]